MSDYCESCGCRQEDSQFSNLHHYTNCPNAPGGAILHLKRRDQDERNAKEDEIERLRERVYNLKELNKVIGDHANNLVETVVKQDKRIEELEKSLKARFRGDYDGEGIFITTAQINAAWEYAMRWAMTPTQKAFWDNVFSKLGIEWCGGEIGGGDEPAG